jgi:uncharacterized C2H2 Zn-finger protein
MEMSIRLYLIPITKDGNIHTYNIVDSVNITEHIKLLKKYSPFFIEKPINDTSTDNKTYQQFNIRSDFRDISPISTLENYNFIDIINTKFGEYKIKPNWYQFDLKTLENIKQFISPFLPPLSGTQITLDAKYKCITCQLIYKDQRCFNKHVKECSLNTTYKCQTCGVEYKSSTRYHNHIQKCQSLVCNICQKDFSSAQILAKHQVNCGTFQCEKCPKILKSKNKYIKHSQRIHNFTPLI